jgi:hypothetical protein
LALVSTVTFRSLELADRPEAEETDAGGVDGPPEVGTHQVPVVVDPGLPVGREGAQLGRVDRRVPLVATPSRSASYTPRLAARQAPRSSAFTTSNRSSAP